jgi:hypothetical protein
VKAFGAVGHNYSEGATLILCGDDDNSCYQDIDSNHKGFWKFIDNGNDSGSSGNDLTSASVATADYSASRQDKAVELNGTDAYYYISNASAGDFDFGSSDDYSLEVWFRVNDIDKSHGLISKWDGSIGYYLEVNSLNKLNFRASDGTNNDDITGGTTLQKDEWYHAAVSCDRDGTLTLYLNGATDATPVNMSAGSLSNTTDFRVGRAGSNYLDGFISFAAASAIIRSSSYFLDSAQTPKIVKTVSYSVDVMLECFSECNNRYWRFIVSDSDNSAGYLDLGRIFLGDWFEPTRNYHGNWSKKVIDPSSIAVTKNNIEFSDLRESYFEIDLRFPKEVQINQSDMEQYENMFKTTGKAKRLFISLDYANHPREWSYYGTLTGDFLISHLTGTSHTDGKWIINNLKFKESR